MKRNVPRAIAQFEPDTAAPVLLRHLRDAGEGMVRFRFLTSTR